MLVVYTYFHINCTSNSFLKKKKKENRKWRNTKFNNNDVGTYCNFVKRCNLNMYIQGGFKFSLTISVQMDGYFVEIFFTNLYSITLYIPCNARVMYLHMIFCWKNLKNIMHTIVYLFKFFSNFYNNIFTTTKKKIL